ncbi:CHAT domain-containing protein [Actinotalea solisilvae]|uniref:CHAT domain-containing protein n=1 Tax=Actinotalea solisilvae TaxID=2072922 RepID=UPI0018F1DC2B|nr:CHAT domain-containing protein [Actinotalea solisilvae]
MTPGAGTDVVLDALRALEEGFEHNSAGRPARASSAFREVLRRLPTSPADPPGAAPRGQRAGSRPAPDPGDHAADVAYLRARALLGLVMSDFELRADVAASLAVLDEAETWARSGGATGVEVAVLGQRGLLRMRAGDPRQALRDLDRAVAMLDAAEPVDACRVLLNRGSLALELGQRARARADLERSAERAHAIGHALLEFKARHNLGYVEFLAGDLPAALGAMADAEELGPPDSLAAALLDRAQVLLEAGLTSDADRMLARAARTLAEQRLVHDLAQTELARAHVALVTGRPHDALRWARSARRRFARRHNAQWSERAELAVLRASLAVLEDGGGARPAGTAPDGADAGTGAAGAGAGAEARDRAARVRLARRCEALAAVASAGVARAARATAAQALVAAGATDRARVLVDAVGRLSTRDLALTLQVRAVRVQIALAEGRPDVARRETRAGQALLADQRRRLGSVEAVTAAAVHGERLALLDVGAALASRDPAAVLAAVERGRATTAGPARVRPPDDPVLAEVLAELRQGMERARARPPGEVPPSVERELARLRSHARERTWRLGEGTRAPRAVTARQLLRALRPVGPRSAVPTAAPGTTVADLVAHDGRVHAVVADPAGLRLLDLAPLAAVDEVARRLGADLQVLANPLLPAALRDGVRRSLARGLEQLDAHLVRPLGADGPLHVVAGGALVTLPWGLVPSRVGRATSVSPRLQLAPVGERATDAVALAGPGLGHARAEAEVVAATWPRARLLVGEAATASAATDALRTAGVVHLAAHGRHEADNPLFSWVRLADGPLFAHELEGAVLPGSLVVLSACEVGRASVRPGGEVLGLANVLLRLGAGAVVACLAPLRDAVAARVMPTLHVLVRGGASPAEGLAAACSGVDEPVALTCFAPLAVDLPEHRRDDAGGQHRGG